MSLCKTIQGYDSIYIRRGYGIDCECTELDQRHQALFHIQERLKTSNPTCDLEGNCFACGINKNTSYTCAYQTITALGPNNLMAHLDLFDYCYKPVGDLYHLFFIFTVTYTNPSTITISPIDISLDTIVQPLTNITMNSIGGNQYQLDVEIPNSGSDMYARIRVSDGTSNIDFPVQDILITTKSTCV